MDENGPKLGANAIGRGHAKLPVPGIIRLAHAATFAALVLTITSVLILLQGWDFLERINGQSNGQINTLFIPYLIFIFIALALATGLTRLGILRKLFALRKSSGPSGRSGKTHYTGFSGKRTALAGILAPFILTALCFGILTLHFKRIPIPDKLAMHFISSRKSNPDIRQYFPVYFWDYSTWIDPAVFSHYEIYVPYEKGPPEKLLARIIFRDIKTGAFALELHGRRPRNYQISEIDSTFQSLSRQWQLKLFLEKLPLLYRLEKEAGIISKNGKHEKPAVLNLFVFDSNFRIIGLPWEELSSGQEKSQAGKFFFLSQQGDVFQVRCPVPCALSDLLARIEFPDDPRGSIKERASFTGNRIRDAFGEFITAESDPHKKELLETRLKLYLVSLITLNPQDPEGYFHLGKLTQSKDTLQSLIAYGRDVHMDAARLAELESRLLSM